MESMEANVDRNDEKLKILQEEKLKILKNARRIVIKVGSAVIARDGFALNRESVAALTREISVLSQKPYEIVVVSSGAILAGMEKLGLKTRPRAIPHKQAIAAIGQSSLMRAWESAFGDNGRSVAQILLTTDDICDRQRYINGRNTLFTLLRYGVVPIVNENDTVVTNEIKFGDNDRLSGLVAGLISADLLIVLSHVDGLYATDAGGQMQGDPIPFVDKVTEEIKDYARSKTSFIGTGGMQTKILAAQEAARSGIATWIINGKNPHMLTHIVTHPEEHAGTFFFPEKDKLTSRKAWIGYALRPKGKLVVDDGARHMLLVEKKSLLSSGIVQSEGNFRVGDLVQCVGPDGREFARGLVNYNCEELQVIKGKKSGEIESLLGYKYYDEVIHRDDLVIL
ncbi:MAG: glutamate 5-kinase [bacterium]